MEASVVVRAKPWDKVSTLIESLLKLLGKPFEVKALRRDESARVEDASIAWLCQLRRLGYKLQLNPREEVRTS